MKHKERYIEDSYPEYVLCLLFGIVMSIVMTILSIEAYITKDMGFGFLVVFAIMSYIWTIVSIVIGIRELIVVRNNNIIEYILDSQDNDYLIIRSTIDKCRSDIEKLQKEVKQCKKKSC